ncbi:MAG: threonine--tRNA ligase [Nanoarchaeota archaeon]|nr:threonine--tRNA ligase [Nanoarchaeota archaeon]
MIEITFPDKSKKQFSQGATGFDVAQSISEGLARVALAVKINGKMQDLYAPLNENADIEIVTFKTPEGKDLFRHSTAHLLAHAIKRLYPEAKPTIGPAVEEGFYYDFDDLHISTDDFPKIEEEMKKIVKEEIQTKRIDYQTKEEALAQFKNNPYKAEMIENLEEGLSAYEQGDFIDLCRGPHIPNTKMIKAFKLTKLAAAYWRGDANNKQLTRVYGISFPDKKELNEHLRLLEEAQKRDHRKLGRELMLYTFNDLSPGAPFFHEKGTFIYTTLQNFIREEYVKRGYQEVITPLLYDKKLWEMSGHWEHYQEDMFVLNIDNSQASLKPMNCPSHCLMFKTTNKSYRDLPVRIADFAPLHRNELRGALSGLTRVRKFSQDDAHIFCREDQIQEEIKNVMSFIDYVLGDVFKMDFSLELSTKPEKALGTAEMWEKAEGALEEALNSLGLAFQLNPGDGAFYGPKIDVHVKDALHRSFQLATIQVDFNLPERFELEYDGEDGKRHRPVMIHRAVLGSIERFMGILVEHFAGKFPLWISPNQTILLPIADRHNEYCQKVVDQLKEAGLRAEVDDRSESTKKKVRDAQLQQYNYMLIVGDKEMDEGTINIRTRQNEVLGSKKVDEFIKELLQEKKAKIINEKELHPTVEEEQ